MVEQNRFLDVLTWVVLLAGIALVGFPVYVTFVASTLTADQVHLNPAGATALALLIAKYA